MEGLRETIRYGCHRAIGIAVAVVQLLDASSARDVVSCHRYLEDTVVRGGTGRLHQTLPEALTPYQYGSVQILQRAGDDLAGRGGGAIDQHGQGEVQADRVSRSPVLLPGLGQTTLGLHHLSTLGDKHPHDIYRSIQHAAGISSEVEHQSLKLPRAAQPLVSTPHVSSTLVGKGA